MSIDLDYLLNILSIVMNFNKKNSKGGEANMRGSGSGQTPENVVSILRSAMSDHSFRQVAKGIGINVSAVHRYVHGIGEPTTTTLRKLSTWSGRPVSWLRGEQ
jgi:transcriptional regulator with XRE-family HTH domain